MIDDDRLEKEPFDAWDLERILWSSPPVSPVAPRTSEDLFDDKNGHLMGTMMDQQMEYDGFCLFPPIVFQTTKIFMIFMGDRLSSIHEGTTLTMR